MYAYICIYIHTLHTHKVSKYVYFCVLYIDIDTFCIKTRIHFDQAICTPVTAGLIDRIWRAH